MKNSDTILLSLGVLLVGFALLTPLLFFLIGLLLKKGGDTGILLEMEYAFLSFIGIVLLILGTVFSARFLFPMIMVAVVASISLVCIFLASDPRGVFDWIVMGCYYLSLLVALILGMAILHTTSSSY